VRRETPETCGTAHQVVFAVAEGYSCGRESTRQSPSPPGGGGKSGLHRAGRQVTPGGREPTESAAENIPPMQFRLQVRVKWCGKSAPRGWQHAWHGKPRPEQDQIGI